jgi:mRNA-degrading endonuclease RelE of RelBE toxin-antitoxin system
MKPTKIEYHHTTEFKKDLKKLSKRFRSLPSDLETVKKNVIELYHIHKIDNHSNFPIPGFVTPQTTVYKIKKFACKSLKGKGSRSGIRVIYVYHSNTKNVDFIEIYYKQDQENETRERIIKHLKNN